MAFFSAVVIVSYVLSTLMRSKTGMGIFSSLYFVMIDIMLLWLLNFCYHFTGARSTLLTRSVRMISQIYFVIDAIIFVLNPFTGIAIDFVPRDGWIAHFSYVMKPLYYTHLFYTYTLVVISILLLLYKIIITPKMYRDRFFSPILAILGVVILNAIFLYLPGDSFLSSIDFSIFLYTVALSVMYWDCFVYNNRALTRKLSKTIFDNIDKGIVLFDCDSLLAMANSKAHEMLRGMDLVYQMEMPSFLEGTGIPAMQTGEQRFSIQCYMKGEKEINPLRCDYRCLTDKKGQVTGHLFVFTDVLLDSDLLTGFHNLRSFRQFAAENPEIYGRDTAVVIFDINGLGMINSARGREEGDRLLKELAQTIRQNTPPDAYYVRGENARLIAVCPHQEDEKLLQEFCRKIQSAFTEPTQYAIGLNRGENLLQTMDDAQHALEVKKLLDASSPHSALVASLMKALQETDSDTEAHVRRTQILGEKLGPRIGLSDSEQSNLSLLCVIHDIGKVSIPLEILNKPGKLTPQEWEVLKSHVTKGYHIAASSRELKGVAEMILYHHERWDGKGYPEGLSRESIPLLSRVISVVDAYDAMTNKRVYNQPKSVDEALAEIKKCAGTQFDPFIAASFIQMIEETIPAEERRIGVSVPSAQSVWSEPLRSEQDIPGSHTVTYSRYLLDADYRIVEIDTAFTEMTGYTEDDLKNGLTQIDLIPADERTGYLLEVQRQMAAKEMAYLEHRLVRKDGFEIYVFCYGKCFYDSAVQKERSEIIIANIGDTHYVRFLASEENQHATKRLKMWEDTYRRDALTGLLNHAAFRSDVESRLLRGMSQCLFIMIDIDRFKEINDRYGHEAGDQFLIRLAQCIDRKLRKKDLSCRMGGDEFACALFFGTSISEERIRERAKEIYQAINQELLNSLPRGSISAGAVIRDSEKSTFQELYRDADKQLYEAKNKGRSRIVFAESEDKASHPTVNGIE